MCVSVRASSEGKGKEKLSPNFDFGGKKDKTKKKLWVCLIGKLPKLSSSSSLTLLSLWITFPGSVRTGWAGRSAAGERLGGSGRSAA